MATEDTQLQMEKWTRLLVIVSTILVLIVFASALVRLGLYIHHTILLFSLGVLVAYALDPLVEALRLRPELSRLVGKLPHRTKHDPEAPETMPRGAAIAIVFVGLIAVVGLSMYGLSRPLTREVHALNDKRQKQLYLDNTERFLGNSDASLQRIGIHTDLHQQFSDYLTDPSSIPVGAQNFMKSAESAALPFVRDLIVSAGESVIVLLIALYMLIYCRQMRVRVNELVPDKLRRHLVVWEEDVNRILGGYVRGQLTIAILMGVAAAIGCLALGIHIWLIIGLFVAIASLIPVFGPYIGAVPAVIAALVGPTHLASNFVAALILMAFFVVINEVGSKVLYPRLVGQAIGLHEVLVLFVIFAGLEIDGIPGVLFAAPVTAIVIVTLVHLYRFWLELPDSLLSVRR